MAKILRPWRRGSGGSHFERVVRPHLPGLYRLAWRLTGSEPDAEDLLQDLLLRLHDRAEEIAALDRPDLWLARVLYRLFVDEHRRSRLRPLPAAERRSGSEGEERDPVSEAPAQPGLDAEARAAHHFDSARLTRALDSLPEDQRAVVLLHDVEGYRLTELSELLEAPVGTLKSRLHRARRRLRERLSKDGTF